MDCAERKKIHMAILEEFDGQYRDHVNFLEKEPAQNAGFVNLQRSPAPRLGMVTQLMSKVSEEFAQSQ